jgi:hypothetical protein
MYSTIFGSYNIVIGMDWLESHEAILDCKNKNIYFIDNVIHKIILVGMNRGVSLRFISSLHLKKHMIKGYKLYVVIAMNKEDIVSIEHYPMLSKFLDVFPKEIPRLLLERDLNFTIELKP